MPGIDWLTARPIAHRGLHDPGKGVVENTGSAFRAAIAGNFAIECDLQLSGDGEAMVFHDSSLERLTTEAGPIAGRPAQALQAVAFKHSSDRMLTLGELCDLVQGRVTLLLELKSQFDGNAALADRAVEVLRNYAGPVAAMSFDPFLVAAIRERAPGLPRGLVAQNRRASRDPEDSLPLLPALKARPHFLAWSVTDLPAILPLTARYGFGLPLLTWTVRSESDRARARRWADQMIFEGFTP